MNLATATMLDGIKEACETWGRAMRWILQSDGEGYPTLSTFERARGGELSANDAGTLRQRFGEVMVGDALAVSLAIRTFPVMPEESHRVIFMHFVVPRIDAQRRKITVRAKARELGYEHRDQYYIALDNGLHFLLARVPLELEVPRGTNCRDTVSTV